MRIIQILDIEECLDGTFIKELIVDENLKSDFIKALGRTGTFNYYKSFMRPYFKIETECLIIKGVEDDNTIRVIVKNNKCKGKFESFCENINEKIFNKTT